MSVLPLWASATQRWKDAIGSSYSNGTDNPRLNVMQEKYIMLSLKTYTYWKISTFLKYAFTYWILFFSQLMNDNIAQEKDNVYLYFLRTAAAQRADI